MDRYKLKAYEVAIQAMEDLGKIIRERRQVLADLDIELAGPDTSGAYLKAMDVAIERLKWDMEGWQEKAYPLLESDGPLVPWPIDEDALDVVIDVEDESPSIELAGYLNVNEFLDNEELD